MISPPSACRLGVAFDRREDPPEVQEEEMQNDPGLTDIEKAWLIGIDALLMQPGSSISGAQAVSNSSRSWSSEQWSGTGGRGTSVNRSWDLRVRPTGWLNSFAAQSLACLQTSQSKQRGDSKRRRFGRVEERLTMPSRSRSRNPYGLWS